MYANAEAAETGKTYRRGADPLAHSRVHGVPGFGALGVQSR